jgi:hypothetical protein
VRTVALVFLGIFTGCPAPCRSSADIQITLLLDGVDRPSIAQLWFGLAVNGGATRHLTVTPSKQLPTSTTVLFRPDPAPAQRYSVTVTVEALNDSGFVEAIGSASGEVSANGCNRMELRLTPLPMTDGGPVGADASFFDDLARSVDLTPMGDMMVCSSGMPDEDADGRADFCDICAADVDPIVSDSDSDGVPDACDPDPNLSGNQVTYFEPFNGDSGHWSGSFSIMNGSLNMVAMPGQGLLSVNGTDEFPDGIRVQTYVTAPFLQGAGSAAMGIFLGDEMTQNGVLCTLTYHPGGTDTLDLDSVSGGLITGTTSSALPFGNDVIYRVQLTQRGANFTCEGVAELDPTPLSARVSAALTDLGAPQFVALRALNVEAHFLNVFAVTAQ